MASIDLIPTTADIDRVAALSDPVIRNLQITQCYHDLAAAMAVRVSGANWCWGSWVVTQIGANGSNDCNGLDNGNGIFFRSDSGFKKKLTSITDGTSNTFMVGEDIPVMNQHCDWVHSNHAVGTCAIPLNNAMDPGQPGYGQPWDWTNVYSFRSRHTGGANFAYGDGSVRFVSDSISLPTYYALATSRLGDLAGSDAP